MGLFSKRVILDATTRQVVANLATAGTAPFGSVVQGDTLTLQIVACQPSGNTTGNTYVPIDLSGSSINVAFGTPGSTPTNTASLAANAGNFAVPTITIARVTTGVNGNAVTNTNEVQSLAISNIATGGTFSLTANSAETSDINFGATASDISNALIDAPNWNFAVTKSNNYSYLLSARGAQSNQALDLITVTTNILLPAGKQINIPLTNTAFNTLLNGNASVSTTLEIEANTGGDRNTLFLDSITLYNDLIN